MCKVLDEYRITDPDEREEVRAIWFAMAAAESAVREREREKEEKERDKKRETDHTTHPAHRRR